MKPARTEPKRIRIKHITQRVYKKGAPLYLGRRGTARRRSFRAGLEFLLLLFFFQEKKSRRQQQKMIEEIKHCLI
jgi:hypothetical protein